MMHRGRDRGVSGHRRSVATGVQEVGELRHPVALEEVQVARLHVRLQDVDIDPEAGGFDVANPTVQGGAGPLPGIPQVAHVPDGHQFRGLADVARPAIHR
jgi:hypothetical protein